MADNEPIAAQLEPYKVTVQEGKRYFWCACGRSQKQPFCDGSHSTTDIQPVMFQATESGDVWFCGCKATGNSPMCDGTHNSMGDNGGD